MQINFQKLCPEAKEPQPGSKLAAAFDLTAVSKTYDQALGCLIYGTGLALEIPKGHVGLLFPRSSIYKTDLQLANSVGVIDADYRGEVKVIFRKLGLGLQEYAVGERVAQLMILPVPAVEFVKVLELSKTERGQGGFGSSGN